MSEPPPLKKGDAVWVSAEGRRVEGTVRLASPNHVSLFLEFEAIFYDCVGQMPVLWENGSYRCIINGGEVVVEPREPNSVVS